MKRPSLANLVSFAAIAVVLFLVFGGALLRELRTPLGRKALPAEASDIIEHLSHGAIGGDFARFLKASLPENRYSDYAKSLGLSERFNPQKHQRIQSTLNMTIDDAPSWWTPPEVDSTAYFEHKEGDDYLRVLRYHDGSVYFLVLSW
jgi:hypothetical protein